MQQATMLSSTTMMHAPCARAPSSTSLRATLLPLRTSRRSASRAVRVQAAINTGSSKDGFVQVSPEPPVAPPNTHHLTPQFANSIGLPTDEGIFGFRPFAENWVGRLAMMASSPALSRKPSPARAPSSRSASTPPTSTSCGPSSASPALPPSLALPRPSTMLARASSLAGRHCRKIVFYVSINCPD